MKKILGDLIARFNALSAKEKAILYAALACVAIAVADRAVISPVTRKLGALDKEIADMHASIKRDLRMLSQKDRIALESTKYRSFLAKEGGEEEEFSGLMKEVETLANKTGINLLDMKPGQVKTVESAKQYQVTISIEASLKRLTEFMYAVETSKQLLKIEKFQISVKSKEDATVKSTVTISRIILLSPE